MISDNNNKSIYILSLFLLIALTACGIFEPSDEVSNTEFVAEEAFSFEVPVNNHILLDLEAINGNIEISGVTDASMVKIWGERRVASESLEDAELYMKELQVRVTDTKDEIFVKTIQPKKNDGRNFVVDYNMTLPQNLELSVENINGKVHIDRVNNRVSVGNVNGQVHLVEVVGSVSVNVVNGQIEAELTLPLDGSIDMRTVNGQIDLDIPEETSARLSAQVTNGNIFVSNLVLDNEVKSRHSLSGTLADGQGMILLRTVNGGIHVSGY